MKKVKPIDINELKIKTRDSFSIISSFDNLALHELIGTYKDHLGMLATTKQDEKEAIKRMKSFLKKDIFLIFAFALKEKKFVSLSLWKQEYSCLEVSWWDCLIYFPNHCHTTERETIREWIGRATNIEEFVVFYNKLVVYLNEVYIDYYNSKYSGELPECLQ
jgi:hypothetical protein